jgi:hypothetical protein
VTPDLARQQIPATGRDPCYLDAGWSGCGSSELWRQAAGIMGLTVDSIETIFRIEIPRRHRALLLDPLDPIHDRKEILTPEGNDVCNIFKVNRRLRGLDWKEWPEYLVAFASNGCGDYFAYDTRINPYRIFYIGPIATAPDAVAACEEEGFVFSDFDDWYNYTVSRTA